MGQISLQIPQVGLSDATEDPKVANDLTTIQAVINGNLDASNISPALAQSASVNQSGQVTKGVVNIASSQSTSSTTYTLLATPDQVTNVVLPANGKLLVGYQAVWQESVAGAARAAIFLGTNQLQVQGHTNSASGPLTQAAATNGSIPTQVLPLFTGAGGLYSAGPSGTYLPDVSTGQAIGFALVGSGSPVFELGGTVGSTSAVAFGGSCEIFAAAGTYTVSVQFKASSGSVTANFRKLWVEARSYS